MHDSATLGNANGANGEPLTLTVPEVSRELKLSIRTAWALVHSGKLPSFKIGRSRRVTRQALLDYIEERKQATS